MKLDCKKCEKGKVTLKTDKKNIENGFTITIKRCDVCNFQYGIEIFAENNIKLFTKHD